jgi:membrane-bound serine protease (ClpP class)
MQMLANLRPDGAVILLTLGILLIYVELNRPGWIIPGAVGLLAVLFSAASLGRLHLNAGATILTATALMLLLLGLLRQTPPLVSIAATLALAMGLNQLISGPGALRVHPVTAISCGTLLGAVTSILTRIARRARTNKGLD